MRTVRTWSKACVMQSLIRSAAATATLTVTLALTAPAVASAEDPGCEGLSENLKRVCEAAGEAERVWTREAEKGGGSSGLSAWVSDHAGLLVLGFLAVMGTWIALALMRENAEDRAKRAAAEAARGRALAAADLARRQAEAAQAALAQAPSRQTYDPLGLGLPAPALQVPAVAAAPTAREDLARYAALGGVVPWTRGTALAAVMTRSGDIAPVRRAFAEACELGKLGEIDAETGAFTPAAAVVRVEPTADEGDAALVIRPRSVMTGGIEIDRIRTLLERTARVRHAGPAVRAHATGEWVVVLSNRDIAALEQAAAPAAPTSDIDEDW